MTKSTTETITIRPETPRDYRATENMVREAFWDLYKRGCDEHFIIHKLREYCAFVKELDFIAWDGNRIVGAGRNNLLFMPTAYGKSTRVGYAVWSLGNPVSNKYREESHQQ